MCHTKLIKCSNENFALKKSIFCIAQIRWSFEKILFWLLHLFGLVWAESWWFQINPSITITSVYFCFFLLVSFLFQKLLHFVDIFSSLSNWIFHSFAFIKIHVCYNSSMAQLLIFKEEEIKLEQTNKQTIWQIVTICVYFVCVWKCVDFVGLWNWK